MTSTRVTASFTIPADLLKQVDDVADAQRLSRSTLLETWILEKLDSEKLNVQLLANPAVFQAMVKAFGNPEVLKSMAQAVGQELKPEQLELFHRGISIAHEEAKAVTVNRRVLKKTQVRRRRKKK